jgi:hypothetical protein
VISSLISCSVRGLFKSSAYKKTIVFLMILRDSATQWQLLTCTRIAMAGDKRLGLWMELGGQNLRETTCQSWFFNISMKEGSR